MTEHEVRDSRIHICYNVMQFLFVFHHRSEALIAPVTPTVVLNGGFAMAYMVICCNDIASFHKTGDHVQITSGVFTEAMDQLNDAYRFLCGYINPAIDFVAFVKRVKFQFVKHKKFLSF